MAGWDPSSDFWTDRAVLVTGGTGFLGSHLTSLLVETGADVVVLVRDEVPLTPLVSGWTGDVAQVRGDIRDQELLERIVGEFEVCTVFHLAAQTIVGIANANAVSTLDSNIRGTWALLEAARRSPLLKQIVVASSDKAYGYQPRLPYTEDMPLLAVHPYDVSKACADMLNVTLLQHLLGRQQRRRPEVEAVVVCLRDDVDAELLQESQRLSRRADDILFRIRRRALAKSTIQAQEIDVLFCKDRSQTSDRLWYGFLPSPSKHPSESDVANS